MYSFTYAFMLFSVISNGPFTSMYPPLVSGQKKVFSKYSVVGFSTIRRSSQSKWPVDQDELSEIVNQDELSETRSK